MPKCEGVGKVGTTTEWLRGYTETARRGSGARALWMGGWLKVRDALGRAPGVLLALSNAGCGRKQGRCQRTGKPIKCPYPHDD